jgi:hypothetical protein
METVNSKCKLQNAKSKCKSFTKHLFWSLDEELPVILPNNQARDFRIAVTELVEVSLSM